MTMYDIDDPANRVEIRANDTGGFARLVIAPDNRILLYESVLEDAAGNEHVIDRRVWPDIDWHVDYSAGE